jgi:voltage-gated potassium channel
MPEAKIFTIILILMGIGTITYFVSSITAFIVEGDLGELIRRKRMEKEISKIKDHYIICGIGTVGVYAAEEFIERKFSVVLVDISTEKLQNLETSLGKTFPYIVGDATDDDTLKKASIEGAVGLVASLSNDRDNLFLVLTARQLNPKLRIVSKIIDISSTKKFNSVGADAVVSPSFIGAHRMFSEMTKPEITDFLDYVMLKRETEFSIEEIPLKQGSALEGKTLQEANLRKLGNILVIGAKLVLTNEYIYNPGPYFVLNKNVTLIVLGSKEEIGKLRAIAG